MKTLKLNKNRDIQKTNEIVPWEIMSLFTEYYFRKNLEITEKYVLSRYKYTKDDLQEAYDWFGRQAAGFFFVEMGHYIFDDETSEKIVDFWKNGDWSLDYVEPSLYASEVVLEKCAEARTNIPILKKLMRILRRYDKAYKNDKALRVKSLLNDYTKLKKTLSASYVLCPVNRPGLVTEVPDTPIEPLHVYFDRKELGDVFWDILSTTYFYENINIITEMVNKKDNKESLAILERKESWLHEYYYLFAIAKRDLILDTKDIELFSELFCMGNLELINWDEQVQPSGNFVDISCKTYATVIKYKDIYNRFKVILKCEDELETNILIQDLKSFISAPGVYDRFDCFPNFPKLLER